MFFIKNQAEWKKHLQVDRLIDLEMLKMQVGFSAQEGGFDAFIRMKTNRSSSTDSFPDAGYHPRR